MGVTADGVTLVSLLLGLSFVPLFFVNPVLAITCLWLHVIIDGIDGPLARFRGTASPRGSLTDTVCDQVVVATTTAALIHMGYIDAITGAIYLFCYTLVVAFAMIRNAMEIPYPFALRPRFFVYAWIIVEVFVWPGSLNYLVQLLLVPLAMQAFQGYRAIRRKL
jgi:phosphatidylglycerophosphate synthase